MRADLEKLYAENGNQVLWIGDRDARKRRESLDTVIQVLREQGLAAPSLARARHELETLSDMDTAADADVRLSAEVMIAAQGERFGFVPAKHLGWNLAADDSDIAASLGEAVKEHRLAKFFAQLAPQNEQFDALKEALGRYQEIAAQGGWPQIPEGKEIDYREDPRLPALGERLLAEGYLSASSQADPEALRVAVKTFQARNGLEADGRIGRGTLAALNVSADQRVDQIIANMERWRHMRRPLPHEYVLANVADQSVVVMRDGREDLRLRAVVGTRKHATPMLEAKLTGVTINPPWAIPTSIITNEIVPKLDERPDYLIENGMEVVAGSWDKPRTLRLRQRPGADNSLGFMKFQMQNPWNIYLHDTPSRALFAKTDRYFSHGCVRLDQPHELAMNLIPALSKDEADQLIAAGETKTLKLEQPLPVYVLYWSVFADKDGNLQFRRDAYDRDSTTAAALRRAGLLLLEKSQVVQSGN